MTRQLLVVPGLTACLLVGPSLFAQLPIPTELREARTVYLDNAGVELRFMERAARELQLTKLWNPVASPEEADVIMTLGLGTGTTIVAPVAGMWFAGDMGTLIVQVSTSDKSRVLWRDSEGIGMTTGGVANVVRRLQRRLAQEKRQ